jgi:hypothetical protein
VPACYDLQSQGEMTLKMPTRAAGCMLVIAALSVPLTAQTGPRTPWGDPDIQGTWTTDDTIGVPIQRPPALGNKLFLTDEDLAQQAARQTEARRAAQVSSTAGTAPAPIGPPDHWGENASKPVRQTSFVVDPPDGRIPTVTPDGQKRAAGRDTGSFGAGPFNRPADLTNFDRCISRGVVGSMLPRPYGNGLEIVQGPGFVAIRHEMIHEARVISLGGAARVGPAIRQYIGHSRGRWEGETLVVETANFTDQMSIGFNGNGLRHSEHMTLVERFTRVDAKTMQWEVTIDDPKTYTKPFKMALPIRQDAGYQIFEFACHEGNYGMRNILSGARSTEAGTK